MANNLTLSDMTYDFGQFVSQLENYAQQTESWRGTLTTQTSQTLIDFCAAIGVYAQTQINRASEDAFTETAQSDEAIRANISFQGVRLTRKLPASVEVSIVSPVTQYIAPYTQFSVNGNWFNRDAITLAPNAPQRVTLFQGEIKNLRLTGLGTNHQTFTSPEAGFIVSDLDVTVQLNGVAIPKAKNAALWNHRNKDAYADLTLENGRLLIQFGSVIFPEYAAQVAGLTQESMGTIPGINDIISIQYVITEGAATNNRILKDSRVTVATAANVSGTVVADPTGGANEREPYIYKNVIAGAFGTYESAVTGNQYKSTVTAYPGVVDAVTQAQRDINPRNVQWMNVIRVSALTASPWSQQQKEDFCEEMQSVTMYAPWFLWQDPIPMERDLVLDVFVFNTANTTLVDQDIRLALGKFFGPRQGLLGTDFFESDIMQVVKSACKGQMSYMVDYSDYPMTVGAPKAARTRYTIIPSGGQLTQYVYAYSVAVTMNNGDVGVPDHWVFPQITVNNSQVRLDWPEVRDAQSFRVYGRRTTELGLLTTLSGTATTWTDNGSILPTPAPILAAGEYPIRYNQLRNLKLQVLPTTRPQRIF